MQTINSILLKPEDTRYHNSKVVNGKKLTLNVNHHIGDADYVSRVGVVESIPTMKTVFEVGDRVVVHHNVFRKYWDWTRDLADGSSFMLDGTFNCYPDQVFAYNRGDKWIATEDNCLIKPIKNKNAEALVLNRKRFVDNIGFIEVPSDRLIKEGYRKGDKVMFTEWSDYRVKVDGELLYKMKDLNVICKVL